MTVRAFAGSTGLALLVAGATVVTTRGQQPSPEPRGVVILQGSSETPLMTRNQCRHAADEPDAERVRREEALRQLRAVLAAQRAFRTDSGRYAQLGELSGVPFVPAGWRLQHAASAESFMISIKDETDACGYALYSDHRAVIYSAVPVQ